VLKCRSELQVPIDRKSLGTGDDARAAERVVALITRYAVRFDPVDRITFYSELVRSIGAHEEYRGGGERPSEPGFSAGITVCASAEAFGDVAASVILAAIDLIVRTGEVGDAVPLVGVGDVAEVF
jgi:hypothetical protein